MCDVLFVLVCVHLHHIPPPLSHAHCVYWCCKGNMRLSSLPCPALVWSGLVWCGMVLAGLGWAGLGWAGLRESDASSLCLYKVELIIMFGV